MSDIIIEDDIKSWENALFLYRSALKEISTKIDILSDEFKYIHRYNPIEHVTSRIKSPDSIVNKLKKYEKEVNIYNMIKYVHDIAGIRIICSFTSDIYKIAQMLMSQSDLNIVQVKDYIANPKENGYKSFHLIMTVPIYVKSGIVHTMIEVQIRTIAMDFWASLEHKIRYKFRGNAPEHISYELKVCANIVSKLDAKMLSLNDEILSLSKEEDDINIIDFADIIKEDIV